jgi:hypothetical protein
VPYRIVTNTDVSGIADPQERYRHVKQRSILKTSVPEVIAACADLLATRRENALL